MTKKKPAAPKKQQPHVDRESLVRYLRQTLEKGVCPDTACAKCLGKRSLVNQIIGHIERGGCAVEDSR